MLMTMFRAEPEINLPRSITISRVDPDIEIVEENITRRWIVSFARHHNHPHHHHNHHRHHHHHYHHHNHQKSSSDQNLPPLWWVVVEVCQQVRVGGWGELILQGSVIVIIIVVVIIMRPSILILVSYLLFRGQYSTSPSGRGRVMMNRWESLEDQKLSKSWHSTMIMPNVNNHHDPPHSRGRVMMGMRGMSRGPGRPPLSNMGSMPRLITTMAIIWFWSQ